MIVEPLNNLTKGLRSLLKSKLWLQVIVAIVLGIGTGFLINPSSGFISTSNSDLVASWLDLPGSVFLRIVQMVMIPLVFSSIITGIVSNSSEDLKKMGGGLLLYFVGTTLIAITIAIVMAYVFEPGKMIYESGGFNGGSEQSLEVEATQTSLTDLPTLISDLIPNNPLETILSTEMLGVVIFTVIIGMALLRMQESDSKELIKLITATQKICMTVISWAMRLVPIAVFGLIAALVSRVGFEGLVGLGYYAMVVIIGLVILLVVYLIIVGSITNIGIGNFLNAAREPQLLAFSTASSAAVMPLSMEAADKKLGVQSKVSDFVIPIGASINMDGTALFQCITALFMAQAYGIDLGLGGLLLITFTLIGASIGTPAIPGGGVIILASVLQSSGIPTEGLIIVIGIDRLLGMFRTAINVTGDLVACVVFDRFYK